MPRHDLFNLTLRCIGICELSGNKSLGSDAHIPKNSQSINPVQQRYTVLKMN